MKLIVPVFFILVSALLTTGSALTPKSLTEGRYPAPSVKISGEITGHPGYSIAAHRFSPAADEQTDSDPPMFSVVKPRQIPRDILNAGKIFFSDFVYVYSAPLRLNKHSVVWVTAIGALVGTVYLYDQEVLDAVQRNSDGPVLKPLLQLGDFFQPVGHMGVMNKYYFAGLGIGYVFNIKPLALVSAQILESFFIAGAFKNLAGYVVGRKRPFEDEGPYSFSFNGGTSFPSGHALNITQLSVILAHHIRFLPFQIFSYTVATAVCLQRIDSRNHWPSDVLFGTIFGIAVSKTILKLHEKRQMEVKPVILPNSTVMGIHVSLHR